MYGVQLCLVDARGQDVAAGEVGEILVQSPMTMDG
jgi:non-ribosomal peptide synthetase component E (peptide arylation enzyme)